MFQTSSQTINTNKAMKNAITIILLGLLSNLIFAQTIDVYFKGGGFFHFPSNMTLTEATRENKVVFYAGVDTVQKTHLSYNLESKKTYMYVNGELKSSGDITEINNNGNILDIVANFDGIEEKTNIYKHSENQSPVFLSVYLNKEKDRFEGIYCEGKEFAMDIK